MEIRPFTNLISILAILALGNCKPAQERTHAGGRTARQGGLRTAEANPITPQTQPAQVATTPVSETEVKSAERKIDEPNVEEVEEAADETEPVLEVPPPPVVVVKNVWEFCMRHKGKDDGADKDKVYICSKEGKESLPLLLGNDRGWQGYRMYFHFSGPENLCITHEYENKRGNAQTSENCSSDKVESGEFDLSHDEYMKNHRLKIKYAGKEPACLKLRYQVDRNQSESEFYCSKDNVESGWLDLKDKHDSNKNQELSIKYGELPVSE